MNLFAMSVAEWQNRMAEGKFGDMRYIDRDKKDGYTCRPFYAKLADISGRQPVWFMKRKSSREGAGMLKGMEVCL
jgi:hypothetical protein